MFPAARRERSSSSARIHQRDGAATHQIPDAGHPHPSHAARHLYRLRRGEQQLVVFTAVEREIDRLLRAGPQRQRMDGQRSEPQLRADAGLVAEVGEVGGEPIAQVDGRGGEAVARTARTKGRFPVPRRSIAASSAAAPPSSPVT